MNGRSILALLLLTFATLVAGGSADASVVLVDPLPGRWSFPDEIVVIHPDNTATTARGGRGTWRFLKNPEVERQYEIVWGEGLFIDTLKLSRDGRLLKGRNQKGKHIVATRVPESAK